MDIFKLDVNKKFKFNPLKAQGISNWTNETQGTSQVVVEEVPSPRSQQFSWSHNYTAITDKRHSVSEDRSTLSVRHVRSTDVGVYR